MQTYSLPDVVAGGIDQRYSSVDNSGVNIQNFRYSPDGGWRKDRGWEPLIPYGDASKAEKERGDGCLGILSSLTSSILAKKENYMSQRNKPVTSSFFRTTFSPINSDR